MVLRMNMHVLRAVQAAVATRVLHWYMNGWHIDTTNPEKPMIVGTDGHILVAAPAQVAKKGPELKRGKDIVGLVKIPNWKSPECEALIDTEAQEVTFIRPNGKGITTPRYTTIDGTYPDWKRVVEGANKVVGGKGRPRCNIGVNMQCISQVSDALAPADEDGYAICNLVFGPGGRDGIVVQWHRFAGAEDIQCVWMPCHCHVKN